jgi:hypothetical protein
VLVEAGSWRLEGGVPGSERPGSAVPEAAAGGGPARRRRQPPARPPPFPPPQEVITISKDKLPGYDEKIKMFYEEHIHNDEEIRFGG